MVAPVKGLNPYATQLPNPPNRRPEGRAQIESINVITESPKLQPRAVPLPTTQVEFKTIGRFINTYA